MTVADSDAKWIDITIAKKVTFATQQSAVPIIADLVVRNQSDEILEGVTLSMVCDPQVLAPRSWKFDRFTPGGEIRVRDRTVSLDGGMLSRLNEAMRAQVTLTLSHSALPDAPILETISYEIVALARNEWGGASTMQELLAAFVMPNDPAVAVILRDAAEVLRGAGKEGKLDGYQSKSRQRVWEVASAIWSAVCAKKLVYCEPPASFERSGQKIRTPSDVLNQGLATCLDSAVLFCAAFEQAGLHPILVLVEGHVMAGVWLQPTQFPTLTTEDPVDVRKHVAMKELVLFETTLATSDVYVSFGRAIQDADIRMTEEREAQFVYALDLRQARGRKITPLAIELAQSHVDTSAASDAAIALQQAPELPPFDLGLDDGPPPDSPETRIDHWKRKLLDLTKRNRLLNLKPSKTAIRMVCPDPAKLEDLLSAGSKVSIVPVPVLPSAEGGRDSEAFRAQNGVEFERAFAEEALGRNELAASVDQRQLEAGLIELYRKANSDLQEGGANTLFLAIGVLRWKVNDTDSQSYRAPLLLLPVTLKRASAVSKVSLSLHEDEPTFNLTLLEMMRQDFGIRIPEVEGALPKDASGIDVAAIWNSVRRAIREVPGFEVVEDVMLSTFSFSKYLMWKDLSARTDQLKNAPLVRHLIESPRDPYQNSAQFIAPDELDEKIDPVSLFMPLYAGSSQVVAVHASGQSGDFILEGPPGTGKSQTISNIIAHNIGMGRRVLFVAEKMVALNVVYDRLRKVGLGDFCLELHSNKANKRDVLNQLNQSWRNRVTKSASAWETEAARLKELRQRLNGLVEALHKKGPTGISARQAISKACGIDETRPIKLSWPSDLQSDHAQDIEGLEKLKDLARRLGQGFGDVLPNDHADFASIEQAQWSNQWSEQLALAAKNLLQNGVAVGKASAGFAQATGLPNRAGTLTGLTDMAALASSLTPACKNYAFGLLPDGLDFATRLQAGCDLLLEYRKLKLDLSQPWPDEAVAAIDVEDTTIKWAETKKTLWPFGAIQSWLFSGQLQKSHFLPARPDVSADMAIIAQLQETLTKMKQQADELPVETGWKHLNTDVSLVAKRAEQAIALRGCVTRLAEQPADIAKNRQAVRLLIKETSDLLEAGMPLATACASLVSLAKQYAEASAAFSDLAKIPSVKSDDIAEMTVLAQAVIDKQPRLNAWCRWQSLKQSAADVGLEAVVDGLECGVVPSEQTMQAFEAAYCRWLAPVLIDANPVLRDFSAIEHEDLINRFRALDEKVAKLSAEYVRAKLSGGLPNPEDPNRHSGFGVLKHEVQKQRAHKPVRQLVGEMGDALTALAPCLLMSPLSVAQFLDTNRVPFDLVIFDEASQITVWDAIGSIARGRNAIIVGDPKQMPPTSFFDRSASTDDGSDGGNEEDLESILDEAMAASVKHHRLTGHYRSRHESLIAFSNHRYYGGDLVTYPCAETRESAVSFHRCDGLWQRGKERTNPVEAKAVVKEVVRRLCDPALNNLSIGIVTLNAEQQRLIMDLLDDERRKNPSLEQFFNEDGVDEPVFIKNLETVQGDQRDVILLSIGYGPDQPGAKTMPMRFGPLLRKGGERRLNVAITRATSEVVIFASFDADMIDLSRTQAEAVKDLKHYIDFAVRGPVALGEAILSVAGTEDYDSPFEEAVARGLQKSGWIVHTQIGVSKFRVDLGIVHPDAPGRYLAGIECDGATYHSTPTARDRDRVRHAVLEGLGWSLVRIWSTEYFNDPNRVLEKVDAKLTELLEADRAKPSKAPHVDRETETFLPSSNELDNLPEAVVAFPQKSGNSVVEESSTAFRYDKLIASAPASNFAVTPPPPIEQQSMPFFSGWTAHLGPQSFGDQDYNRIVGGLCKDLVDHFGPITFVHLAEKVARAHGFLRTGSQIKKIVWHVTVKSCQYSSPKNASPTFWPAGQTKIATIPYRGLKVGGEERGWSDVPYEEKLGLASEIAKKTWLTDPVAAMAERLGLRRLREKTREELVELIEQAAGL
jgi:very-short-patch-repair endonuclease